MQLSYAIAVARCKAMKLYDEVRLCCIIFFGNERVS